MPEAWESALVLPETAKVVAIDLGESDNIRPKNKKEVGRRMALIVLAKNYGSDCEYSGPVVSCVEFAGDVVLISLKHAAGIHPKDGSRILGFEIAGADRQFYPAEAEIVEGRILVRSDRVLGPEAGRYGWRNNPNINLHNAVGLPMAPYRSDGWAQMRVR